MKIIPHTKEEWLRFVLLPFKAYSVVAPMLFLVCACLPRPRRVGATDAEFLLIAGLFPCSALLLFTSLVLALVGLKDAAIPCAVFGVAGFVIGYALLPSLAR